MHAQNAMTASRPSLLGLSAADAVSCRPTASCGGAPSCRERGAEGRGSVWTGTPTPPEHLSPFGRAALCSVRRLRRPPVEEIRGVGSRRGSRSGPDSLPVSWVRWLVPGEPKPGPKLPRGGPLVSWMRTRSSSLQPSLGC